mgnify:CR=1 FL=1
MSSQDVALPFWMHGGVGVVQISKMNSSIPTRYILIVHAFYVQKKFIQIIVVTTNCHVKKYIDRNLRRHIAGQFMVQVKYSILFVLTFKWLMSKQYLSIYFANQ